MRNEVTISGLLIKNDDNYELLCSRNSGTVDRINIQCNDDISDLEGNNVTVHGKLFSKRKRPLFVDADFVCATRDIGINHVNLYGRICKLSSIRRVNRGREVVTVILAVGDGNYIPCLLWNGHARSAKNFNTGDVMSILGRLQSRTFIKKVLDTDIEKTTYEVSVMSILD